MAEYKILKTEGRAKRAEFKTVHGTVQTPVFMNVGTVAAIKGAVATTDLKEIGTQIELSNTYHLHVRPGDEVVKKRRTAPLYELGSSDPDGFRRIPGIFPCESSENHEEEYTSSLTLTGVRFSWDRKRVCRFSQSGLHDRDGI